MSAGEARTTLYLRGMPRVVVLEAKAAAARRGTTLAAIVAEALERSIAPARVQSDDAELANDIAWYEQNRRRLLRRYRGQHVAIVAGRVVDHDRDFSTLALRAFRRFGERSMFMPQVGEEQPLLRFRSPRVVQ